MKISLIFHLQLCPFDWFKMHKVYNKKHIINIILFISQITSDSLQNMLRYFILRFIPSRVRMKTLTIFTTIHRTMLRIHYCKILIFLQLLSIEIIGFRESMKFKQLSTKRKRIARSKTLSCVKFPTTQRSLLGE